MKRIALALALSACTPLPCETCARAPRSDGTVEVTLCIDDAFDADQTEAAHVAADAWTDALCGLVVVTPVTIDAEQVPAPAYCDRVLYRVESSYSWITILPSSVGGFVEGDNAWIIVDRIDPALLSDAIAHEIGHMLGVSHGDGLMLPILHDGGCVDRRAAVLAAMNVAARNASQCRMTKGFYDE